MSGFGAEREQLDEGAEEGVQPALVGHALLHHLLLTRVLSCLFDGVGLEKRTKKPHKALISANLINKSINEDVYAFSHLLLAL